MTSDLPLIWLSEGPGPFDPLEEWEQYLTKLQSMPDFIGKESVVENAKRVIVRNKQALASKTSRGTVAALTRGD